MFLKQCILSLDMLMSQLTRCYCIRMLHVSFAKMSHLGHSRFSFKKWPEYGHFTLTGTSKTPVPGTHVRNGTLKSDKFAKASFISQAIVFQDSKSESAPVWHLTSRDTSFTCITALL